MPNYQLSKIYKLVCDDESLVYYGSTTQSKLCKRLGNHNVDYKRNRQITSKALFDVGNVKIILVEKYPCETKDELLMRERWYIENNVCVNKCYPIVTSQERKETKKKYTLKTKEQKKEYDRIKYQQNKEKKLKQVKEYYQANKEKVINYHKDYNLKNKDIISKKTKEYYEKNKEKILEYHKEYELKNKDIISKKKKEAYYKKKA